MSARRKAKPHNPPARRKRAGRIVDYSHEITEGRAGRRYTARWHRVLSWVLSALAFPGFDEVNLAPSAKDRKRVEQHASTCVRSLDSAEEAFEEGISLDLLRFPASAPDRWAGGIRRVVITALTWVPDPEGEVGYDPAWITLGHGMTAKQAVANAARFIRDYQRALDARVASRVLIYTAVEIKFWTASQGTRYV